MVPPLPARLLRGAATALGRQARGVTTPPHPFPPADLRVRDATAADAVACAAVSAPYVTGSVATFETEPPDAATTARRIAAAQEHHASLVLVDASGVVGLAHGGPFRPRPAYRWTCETTVYLAPGATGRGAGRLLYGALLQRLAERGLRTATAVVALPNAASEGLHAALGFEPVGTFPRVGWKLGAWRDVAWYRRDLGDGPVDEAAGAAPP